MYHYQMSKDTVYLFIYLLVYLFIYLFVYLFIYLFAYFLYIYCSTTLNYTKFKSCPMVYCLREKY